jgi:hypothetical protein
MSKNKKVTINSLVVMLFFFTIINSFAFQDELSIVVYQRNSFCQLILYSLSKDFELNNNMCSKCNRKYNKITLEADVVINSLSSVESLTSRGNMSSEQGVLTYLFQGFSNIRTQYLNKVKDNNLKYSNCIRLKHIVIGSEGYHGNEAKKNELLNEIFMELLDKNFIIDKQSIIIIDNLDLVKSVALEHHNGSASNDLLVSLNSDINVNFKIKKTHKNYRDIMITEEDILLNQNLSGGYAQLGRETSMLFDGDFIHTKKDESANGSLLFKNILSTKTNEDLVVRKGINLVEWLSKSYGRDNSRGLAIIDNFLNEVNEDSTINYNKQLDDYNDDGINIASIRSIDIAIDGAIDYSISNIKNLLQQQEYKVVVLGEFINNKYIRKKYLTKLSLLDESIRQQIDILSGNEFSILLTYSAERIHYNRVGDNNSFSDNDPVNIENSIKYFLKTFFPRVVNYKASEGF